MTKDEADLEAKRLFGPRAFVMESYSDRIVRIASEPIITDLGRGTSWEEAVSAADYNTWLKLYRFNLEWRIGSDGIMTLIAFCTSHHLKTMHRVRATAALDAEGWLDRAKAAEVALMKRLLRDPRWQNCGHLQTSRHQDMKVVRRELEQAAARNRPAPGA